MVCNKCEEKLSKVIVPDKWKSGARNVGGSQVSGRNNMLLSKKGKNRRFTPMERRCRICKSKVSQDAHYCQECAYKKGICAMCGRRIASTKEYKMSSR
mmetsp:Transcript_20613/g.29831  ORF Transcript_20613/g.29831 Transcript_20613/m.29831 type:complete len:98 (+) Transcript_20613:39-332(+)|eukprot:CAMPEP_0113941026 /NCGR_PEP_ID=MMETSP1339-20121228/7039_1 /TAXON_ID=94617 /ORGANISM="Fibrocapsa japonica" /LENGTH=97 /DNA_ID=CAMNT_0000945055 /DNA_START=19 /DNA_END=312 /DNA_ORIENTATION=+ /assembly_acc=CAM_ASM_000762